MRRRTMVTIVVAAVVVLWVAVVAVLVIGAAGHLRHGRDEAKRATDGLQASTLLRSDSAKPLERAAADFRSAHHALHNPLLTPIRLLPVLGRQLRSVDASSATAGTVADVAAATLRRTTALANQPVPDGAARLRLLDGLDQAVRDASKRIDHLHLGPQHALVRPVATVHADLTRRVDDARKALRDADAALVAARAFFGGPTSYLVVAANNAEMRAGSGMWLVGGPLTVHDGQMTLGKTAPLDDSAKPPADAVTLDDADLRANFAWIHPQTEWRSLMPSPRMDASAALAQRMWAAAGKPAVDGVLVVDAVGLGDLVAATGKVQVDGRTFDRDGIIRELLHDQYVRFRGSSQGARREALSDVADAVFHDLDAGRWKAPDLAEQLFAAVRGRHLLLWSANAAEQRGWKAASVAGDITDHTLAINVLNVGGNKLDWFTTVDASLDVRRAGNDSLVTTRVTLTNHVGNGEPSYVEGPYPGAGTVAGEYKGVVVVDVPGAARSLAVDGVPTEIRGKDGPAQVIGGSLRLKRGETRTVTVQFRLPGRTGHVDLEPAARVQPIHWTAGKERLVDDRPRTVRW